MKNTYDGQKAYKPWVLKIYDFYILFFSNRFIWKCPASKQLELYTENMSANHLDIGVGSGYYLKKSCLKREPGKQKITLMDLNGNSLHFARNRIQDFDPRSLKVDIMLPISHTLSENKFNSIGLNYLLHCLPGSMQEKEIVFKNSSELLADDGVCFGSTIVNDYKSQLAAKLSNVYNKKGIFSNKLDTKKELENNLQKHFKKYETKQIGSVVLFAAWK